MSDIIMNQSSDNNKNNEGTGKTVLVVEDSQVIQNITKHVLEFYKHKVVTAMDGKEALSAIEKQDFDIVLMDIAMPNMNGIECIRRIREMKNKNKKDMPVIAVTGNAEFYTPLEFKKAGFNEFVEKPINFDGMSKLLKQYI
ncbi:MAG: response regulator [Bacteroidetes bacterium]|nr:response regulator [Bacteroidota bacterium]